MTAVSKAPLSHLETFKKRIGWTFKWVPSLDTAFNRDFHVSFMPEKIAGGNAYYNYRSKGCPVTETPGASVFQKDGNVKYFLPIRSADAVSTCF